MGERRRESGRHRPGAGTRRENKSGKRSDGAASSRAAPTPAWKNPRPPLGQGDPLAREERRLRLWLRLGAAFFLIEAAIYVPVLFLGPAASRPFAINSVVKDVLFGALAALAASDVRRFARLVGLIAGGHLLIVALLAIALATGATGTTFPPPRWLVDLLPFTDVAEGVRLWTWLGGAILATVFLLWLYRRALRAQLGLRYLWPVEHATLASVADAILERPAFSPREIAGRVDDFWASLRAGYKWRLRAALWIVCLYPLLRLPPRAPLPLLDRARRREFIKRDCLEAAASGPLARHVKPAIRFAMQMIYMGYYDDPRSYPATGYERFSARRTPPEPVAARDGKLCSMSHEEVPRGRPLEADVVVVGSGAGGAMAARQLVRRGYDVLVVERGSHVDPDDFVEDEAAMYSALYSDGALQLSRDFKFQVLQGTCVGGTTVVNNGVSFDLPGRVLDEWNGPGLDAGIEPDKLWASLCEVRKIIGVRRQEPDVRLNPGADRVGEGIRALGLGDPPHEWGVVEANLEGCLGSGYCNIGCKYGRKLSMLDGVLPETQAWAEEKRRREPDFRGRLRVLPDCEATKILSGREPERADGERKRARGVRCRLRSWSDSGREGRGRSIEIEADVVCLAGGAIHSSRLLMESGIGGPMVGRGLTANIGSHLTADFGDDGYPLRSFDGLQMSHYLEPGDHAGWVMETWFNPVMSQALVMPGWLDDHQYNMERYDQLTCVGVIAGSRRTDLGPDGAPLPPKRKGAGNHVLRRRTFDGSPIAFTPSPEDIETLLSGLVQGARVLFAGGAKRVMPATFKYVDLRPHEDFESKLRAAVRDGELSINTGHPQGGNPMHRSRERGVVDPSGRVHDWENLFVADASIFPSAVTVNPQLTVMALAHRIGSRIE